MSGRHRMSFRDDRWPLVKLVLAWLAAVVAATAVVYVFTRPPVAEPVRRFTRLPSSPNRVERMAPR
jgi:hypothetical protein